MLTTLEGEGTKSTVMASASPGTDSVAVSPVSATRRARSGRASARTSSEASTRSDSVTSFNPSRYGPPSSERITSPASCRVASSREAVLALTPIRRANSLTPNGVSDAASTSSNCVARATEPTAAARRLAPLSRHAAAASQG